MYSPLIRRTLAVAACVASLSAFGPAQADVLVDNFDSTDLTTPGARPWGGTATWRNVLNGGLGNDAWKSGFAGRTNKIRSISDTTPGINDAYNASVESGSIRYNGSLASDGGGITASGAATAAFAFQQCGMQILRETADFDATAYQYLRVTAWLDDTSANKPTPNPLKPEAVMIVQISQFPDPGTIFGAIALNQPAKNAVGPWDATGTSLVGLPVTTAPQAFLIPIKDANTFKVDPDAQAFSISAWAGASGAPAVSSLAIDDWSKVRTVGIWSLVKGAPAQTGSFRVSFAVDDILFLENEPGVGYSAPGVSLVGLGSDTIDVDLLAMPSHDVTLTFADTADLDFSPDSLTFTTSDWDTPQTLTVTSLTDTTNSFSPSPAVTSSDLWYGDTVNNVPASFSVDVVSNVGEWKLLND